MGAALIPAAITAGGAAFSAYEQGQSGKAQAGYYNYLSDTARLNAGLASAEATSQKKQIGAQLANEQQGLTNRINETVGAEKAAVVNGVGAGSRSAQDIIKDTLNKGNLDEMALRMNADIKSRDADIAAKTGALNYGAQATGYGIAGGNARTAARYGQASSLLGGAGSVANSWYMGQLYGGRGGFKTGDSAGGDGTSMIGRV